MSFDKVLGDFRTFFYLHDGPRTQDGQDVRLLRRDRSIENKGVFWGVFRDGGIQPNRYSDLASHIQMR